MTQNITLNSTRKLFFPLMMLLALGACKKEELLVNDSNLTGQQASKAYVENACETECITENSGIYYEKTGVQTQTMGQNVKNVSYTAYNTEHDFVLQVTFLISRGPSNAKAKITATINEQTVVFNNVSSGSTVTHSIPLTEGWQACENISFNILQQGLGSPVVFNENYTLVPICIEEQYPSVTICNQTWMLNNLDVETYRNGDAIPQVQDAATWASLTTGAWCYYQNNSANGVTYGKLYNWYAVNDPRGIAPEGWHVPSNQEWAQLEICLGGASLSGPPLKAIGAWTFSANASTTNTSGFSAIPAGLRVLNGGFNYAQDYGFWWSSSSHTTTLARGFSLAYNSNTSMTGIYRKVLGFSVRCVKD